MELPPSRIFALVCAWASIVISHPNFRKLSNHIALAFVAAVMVCIAILPDMRMSLAVSGVWVAVVFVAYKFYTRRDVVLADAPANT